MGFLVFEVFDRIDRRDQMAERHARLVLTKQIVAGIFSFVLRAQIAGEIMVHELRAVGIEAIYSMRLAKRVVDRGIERGGGHERAELGDGIGQMQTFGHFGSGFEIQRREVPVDVERMTKFLVAAGHFRKLGRQRLHRVVLGLVRQLLRWEREGVIEGHRSESAGDLSSRSADGTPHGHHRGAISPRLPRNRPEPERCARRSRMKCARFGCRSFSCWRRRECRCRRSNWQQQFRRRGLLRFSQTCAV